MSNRRLQLHDILCKISGVKKVYFQPPESVKMEYPCIRYVLEGMPAEYANDRAYRKTNRYMVTVMDKDPDSVIPSEVINLPMCSFDRFYTADNLNHWVFSLYY